jgi:hypothetical protein
MMVTRLASALPAAPAPRPDTRSHLGTATVTGHVQAINGSQALVDLAVAIEDQTTSTDADGTFSAQLSRTSLVRLRLTGDIVPRELRIAAGAAGDVQLDAIPLSGGFDLAFYRQLVRNGFEKPGHLEPLRRWQTNPRIYLRTVDDAGAAIDPKTLDSTETTIRETIPMWTAGMLKADTIERGTGTHVGEDAWLTVSWPSESGPGGICGSTEVGQPGGQIRLYYKSNCGCLGGPQTRPRTVRHEVGHAMGFWHTDSTADLMAGTGVAGCDQLPSVREQMHAAIAYHRPVGNLDPDTDPVPISTAFARPSALTQRGGLIAGQQPSRAARRTRPVCLSPHCIR